MINTYIEIKVFVMKLGHMLFKTALFMKYNKLFLVVLLLSKSYVASF